MCQGCYYETTGKGDTYTSTPCLTSLKLLLLLGLSKNCNANL